MSRTREEELEALRRALLAGAQLARELGITPHAPNARVRARFPFCAHESLGTVRGALPEGAAMPIGRTVGYIVELDTPLPRGWNPAHAPFVPHENVEALPPEPAAPK